MSLTTPVLSDVVSFDASNSCAFYFLSSGGDQVVANRLTITSRATGAIIYNEKVTSFLLQHTVPANTLTNGVTYDAYVITYNANGESSSQSNTIRFTCYTTPEFEIDNIPSGGILSTSSFTFDLTYNQIEGERLAQGQFRLYDAQKTQISSSGEIYPSATTVTPVTISYEFSGFMDNTVYYIQGIGQTAGGTQIQTGLYTLSVSYTKPNIPSVLQLSCNCEGGYVQLNSIFRDIVGNSYPSPPVFIDDSKVDLRQGGSWVYFGNGEFSVDQNFTTSLWGNDFNTNSLLLRISNGFDFMSIRYMEDYVDSGKVYVDCTVNVNNADKYYVYSNKINTPSTDDELQVWLRIIDGLADIKLVNTSISNDEEV